MAEMRDNDSQNYEAWMKEGYAFAIKIKLQLTVQRLEENMCVTSKRL